MTTPGDNPYEQYGQQPGHPQDWPQQSQQPYQPGAPYPGVPQGAGPATPPPPQPQGEGFFGVLFDLNFTRFVTPRFAKTLYLLWLVLVGVVTFTGVVNAFSSITVAPVSALLGLLGALAGGGISLLLGRVGLELAIALVRTSDDIAAMRRNSGA
ncbi:DUF4282 domain-containing protein [Nocardiopsis mangrovi]|uniref:DUF4282 domain-containing protein n=1 Tax=Nocardiopsis mangrovi TaxID=1179818 RepID=A0ABV9DUM0_9ACTN